MVAALFRLLRVFVLLARRLLGVQTALRPGFRAETLEGEDGSIVEVGETRDLGDHALAVLAQGADDRVALEVEAGELGHGGEEPDHLLGIAVDLVLLEVDARQGGAVPEVADGVQVLELAVGRLERLEIGERRDVVQGGDVVVGHVQGAERLGEGWRDGEDHVLLREQATKLRARLQTRQILEAVPLEEDGLEAGVLLEILDAVESFEVEVELVVQAGRAVPTALLAVGLQPLLRHLVRHGERGRGGVDDEPRARSGVPRPFDFSSVNGDEKKLHLPDFLPSPNPVPSHTLARGSGSDTAAAATMPLGFSMGEILVTVGVVAVAFGPKEIPIIARGLGRLTGQAVGAPPSDPRFVHSLGAFPRRAPTTPGTQPHPLPSQFPHPRVRRSDERQRR